MTIQIDAIYLDGVLRPKEPLALPNGAAVRIAVETGPAVADPLAAVVGIGEGPETGDVAERHDDYLAGSFTTHRTAY